MPAIIDVLEYIDDNGVTLVKRVPDNGICEIKWGAQLTVRESQVAVFFRDGKALDVFGPGRYVLKTQNIPIIAKWVTSFAYGPDSPFRSEVYFLNMRLFANLKWGTGEPILFRDSELKMIRLRSHGIFSIRIADPMVFLNHIVGTLPVYYDATIEEYLRNIIVTKLTTVLGRELTTVFDLPQHFTRLSLAVRTELKADLEALGITLHDFYINSVSLPPQVQVMIDTRSGMTALGDMESFVTYKAAMAIEAAANNPGGAASVGVGVGSGLGMGLLLPDMLRKAMKSDTDHDGSDRLSPVERIKQLKELLDMGAITLNEFETKKTQLLSDI